MLQSIPIQDVDPKGYTNLRWLTNHYAKAAGLRGVVKDEDVVREWMIMIRDLGATEELEAQLPNVLSIGGRGHLEFSFHHVCCALAYYSCGQDVFDLMGFISESAGQFLASGAKSHKAWQFLQIMRRVITRAVCREYMICHPDLQSVPESREDLVPFYDWLQSHVVGMG